MAQTPRVQFKAHPPLPISGRMSANAILKRYPQTGALFERLHINRQAEGYESVEELAWRRGLDERRVVEQLRQLANVFPGSRVVGMHESGRRGASSAARRSDAADSSN